MWALIFIVALWSVIIQDGAINRDGILYLKQAYLFSIGQWHDGFELLRWPFFPLIISFIYKFTLIDIQVVAHGLDLSLFAVATYFYLKILNLVYKQKNIIFFWGANSINI